MIFPSESVNELRRNIEARLRAGEIAELEAFREASRADPDDSILLGFLALKAEEAGDLSEAERYAREIIRVRPNFHGGYLLLARILGESNPDSFLMTGYAELGLAKVQFDEGALEDLDVDRFAELCGVSEVIRTLPADRILAVLVEALKKLRGQEHAEIEEELRPHRLVHELRQFRDGVLDRTLVDGILEHGARCEPLLMGILKEFGSDFLTDHDYRVVERALVLLGEIGNPAVLPALTEFLTLDEDDLTGPADWAFRRISFRRAPEALEKVREMSSGAGAAERVVLAQQIAMMPNVPGRSAALSNLTQGIERYPRTEQESVIIGAIAGLYLVEGVKSFQAASLERKYAGSFSEEARSDLRKLRKEAAFVELEDLAPHELGIYEICCKEPHLAEDETDDHHAEPVVKRQAKPGRNEPCWCGSGKKYKKCHLEQDRHIFLEE